MVIARLALGALAATVLTGCSQKPVRIGEPAARPPATRTTAASSASAPSPSAGFRLAGEIAVGGEGRWDYIACDRDAKRLYVPRSDRVMVVDAVANEVVGTVLGTPGVHGVAMSKWLRRGFTSNGEDGSVSVFDLDSLAVLCKVPAGQNPDAIVYDAVSRRVFVFNGRSHDATVIEAAVDPKAPAALAGIPLGGKPEFAVADGTGQLFVNIGDTSEIVRIDTAGAVVTARWPLAPGEAPTGLAIDTRNRRLFAVCRNKLMVVLSADTGALLARLPIGAGADGAAFDPDLSLAFASCGDGTLTIVREKSPGEFGVVQALATRRGARTIALDTLLHRAYLPTADFAAGSHPQPVPGTFAILVVTPPPGTPTSTPTTMMSRPPSPR